MATAETRAAERRAKQERPEPKAEARKTNAEGAAERTKASAPGAHPTAMGRPLARTEETTRKTRRSEAEPEREREPQKPIRPTKTTTFRLGPRLCALTTRIRKGCKPYQPGGETLRTGSRVGSPEGFCLQNP